jgi:hypothetical protein
MAYTAADGPPDLDGVHVWTPATGSAPPALNFWDVTAPAWPRIRLEQITGWRSLPEADDNRQPRTTTHGEFPYPGMMLGKTIVYEGQVRAKEWVTIKAPVHGMNQGFGERSLEGLMTITPFSWIGGVVWTFHARVLSLDFDPKPEYVPAPEPIRWGFALTLRMSDPYFYTGGVKYL